MTTLAEELLQAAEDYEDRARVAGDPEWIHVRIYRERAARLRQREAWARELETRWFAQVKQDGSEPAAIALAAWSKLTGPIPSETAWAAPKEGTVKPYAEEPGRDYRKERDAAYTERNRLVAALARLLAMGSEPGRGGVAWLAEHEDDPNGPPWDPEWRTIVFIEGPTGQLSWHLHDSDVPLFDGLPRGPNSWDGHTTPEKYERVARIGLGGATAGEAKPTDPVKRTCNRHDDCDEANRKAKEAGRLSDQQTKERR